jgi:hypothetical protein
MTGSRELESAPLLSARIDVDVSPVDFEDASFVHDELPIVTRTNSYPLTSPSYAGSVDVVKRTPRHFDEAADTPRGELETPLTSREEQALEPEPIVMEELRRSLKLVYPVVITYTLEYFPGLVVVMLVGHIDSPDTKQFVAAATLSTMVSDM